MFVLILTAGLALRVLAGTAYRPALLYIDSAKYLEGSVATAPQGYQALLRLLEPAGLGRHGTGACTVRSAGCGPRKRRVSRRPGSG